MEKINIKKEIIESYMNEKSVSLNKLASEIGISPATLSRVLNGQRRAGQSVIGKMLKFFNMKFEDLFFYENELTKVNKTSA